MRLYPPPCHFVKNYLSLFTSYVPFFIVHFLVFCSLCVTGFFLYVTFLFSMYKKKTLMNKAEFFTVSLIGVLYRYQNSSRLISFSDPFPRSPRGIAGKEWVYGAYSPRLSLRDWEFQPPKKTSLIASLVCLSYYLGIRSFDFTLVYDSKGIEGEGESHVIIFGCEVAPFEFEKEGIFCVFDFLRLVVIAFLSGCRKRRDGIEMKKEEMSVESRTAFILFFLFLMMMVFLFFVVSND